MTPVCYDKKKTGEKNMAVIKSQFTLRLELGVHAKIRKIAQAENRSMTNMIEYLIKREICRFESENGEIFIDENDIYLS